jgi:hypothetical protein
MKYEAFVDSGHAWVKVSINELRALGIETQISSCSYIRGDNAYLEEDRDAWLFIEAKKAKGETVELRIRRSENSRVRSYASYRGVI